MDSAYLKQRSWFNGKTNLIDLSQTRLTSTSLGASENMSAKDKVSSRPARLREYLSLNLARDGNRPLSSEKYGMVEV